MEHKNRPASMLDTNSIMRFSDRLMEAEGAAVVIRRALEYNLQQKNTEAALRETEKGLDCLIDKLKKMRISYGQSFCDVIIEAEIRAEAQKIQADEEKRRTIAAATARLFIDAESGKKLAK